MGTLIDQPSLPPAEEPVPDAAGAQHVAQMLTKAREALDKVFQVPGLTEVQRLFHAKRINGALHRLEFQSGESVLKSKPSVVELPVAGKCNLRCTMCGLSHGSPQYPNWTLEEVDRFKMFFRYAIAVNPTGAGEPLTNKDFFKMLELFRSYALRVGFYSNATLLTPDKADHLIDLGVEQINISIDGATAETFERIRKHARFDVVVQNVRHFIRRRRERGVERPAVQIAMVLMRDNIHELPDLIRLAANLGTNSVYSMFVSDILPDQRPELEPVRTNAILCEARQVAKELSIPLNAPAFLPEDVPIETIGGTGESQSTNGGPCMCSHPWHQLVIANDGGAGPCCRITGSLEGVSMGNIHDTPPEMLWNSLGIMHLRERLASGNPPQVCRNCPLRTAKIT